MFASDALSVEEWIVLEEEGSKVIFSHIQELNNLIGGGDVKALSAVVEHVQEHVSSFPVEHLDFLAMQAIMLLASNIDLENVVVPDGLVQ